MGKSEKEEWGEKTFGQIKSAGIDPERDTFIFLAGTEYIKPLAKYIPEENIEEPIRLIALYMIIHLLKKR